MAYVVCASTSPGSTPGVFSWTAMRSSKDGMRQGSEASDTRKDSAMHLNNSCGEAVPFPNRALPLGKSAVRNMTDTLYSRGSLLSAKVSPSKVLW